MTVDTDYLPEPEDCDFCAEPVGHEEECPVLDAAESMAEIGFS